MFHDGAYAMGGMHLLWWIFWLALIGVIVFYGWGRPQHRRGHQHGSPLEVLKRRLASGQIAADEYDKRKALLDRDAGAKP